MEDGEKIVTDFAELSVKDGIAYVTFKDIGGIDFEDARKHILDCIRADNGRKRPVFFDVRKLKNITPGAVKYLYNEESNSITKAGALLTNPINPLTSIAIAIMIKINREPFPTKFFTNKEEAIEWLKQFVD